MEFQLLYKGTKYYHLSPYLTPPSIIPLFPVLLLLSVSFFKIFFFIFHK